MAKHGHQTAAQQLAPKVGSVDRALAHGVSKRFRDAIEAFKRRREGRISEREFKLTVTGLDRQAAELERRAKKEGRLTEVTEMFERIRDAKPARERTKKLAPKRRA